MLWRSRRPIPFLRNSESLGLSSHGNPRAFMLTGVSRERDIMSKLSRSFLRTAHGSRNYSRLLTLRIELVSWLPSIARRSALNLEAIKTGQVMVCLRSVWQFLDPQFFRQPHFRFVGNLFQADEVGKREAITIPTSSIDKQLSYSMTRNAPSRSAAN